MNGWMNPIFEKSYCNILQQYWKENVSIIHDMSNQIIHTDKSGLTKQKLKF